MAGRIVVAFDKFRGSATSEELLTAVSLALEPLGCEVDGVLLADPQVSRRHLELRPHDGRVLCTDLGSRNGTLIDGKLLVAPAALDAQTVITLGDTSTLADPSIVDDLIQGRQ